MRANCWMGKKKVEVANGSGSADPQSARRDRAITSTAICGSDLHLYNGFVPTMERATCSATSSWARSSRSAATSRT